MSKEYEKIATYMSSNQLVLNDEKTHLMVFCNKTNKDKREEVYLKAGKHTIKPSATQKLLGANICQSLKWREHVIDNKSSLLNQLNSRINGLTLVSRQTSFKTRLMVANGVYMSKLSNLIQVWGGTQDYVLKALQVTQNKAAKYVTGLSWFTPTRTLLKQCGWLSVRQLVFYHTVLSVHKTVIGGKPKYARDKLCQESSQHTRQQVKFSQKISGKSERSQTSFFYRGALDYNRLPVDLKNIDSLQTFKRKLKVWIRSQIAVV